MKLFLFALLFFWKVDFTIAQSAIIDSLKHELNIAKEDTNKVNLLANLSYRYTWSYADTSIMYAEQALELAQKLNSEGQIAMAQGQMSSALITLGNYPLALDYAFKALPWTEKYGSNADKSYANIGIAMCYREQGDFNTSLVYCRTSLALSDTIHSANFHHASIWGIVGSVYEKNNQPDSAILYGKKAYELNNDWSGILYVLGSAYSKKNNYDSAMFYYRAGLPAAVQNHTEIDLIDIYNGIAYIKKNQGNIDSAAWYAKKALAEKVGRTYPLGLLRSANMLADLYQSQNKDDSTLKYLRVSISLKDSLFNREKTIAIQNLAFKEEQKQKEIAASKLKYQNRLKMYALLGGLVALLVIAFILVRNNRRRQKAFALLQKQKLEIDIQKAKAEKTLDELKNTQAQLIQSEKMASLGELTAGIAHEIQNPLNFVNNFSEVNTELIDEMVQEIDKGNLDDVKTIAKDIKENEQKINHHGKRADAIVKGMLQHSRSSSGVKESTDINALADEYLRLAYYGLRAKDKLFNATMKTNYDESIGNINIIPPDIGRVILNLITNAFYAVTEKRKQTGEGYEPTVSVSTKMFIPPSGGARGVEIRVADNGNGISQKVLDKIFQPFFTTKPTGEGTGLGLSLSYDIIKAHGGEIKVNTKENEGSEFVITLPL
jgi:two-component system, NtrC family, sensor kinase